MIKISVVLAAILIFAVAITLADNHGSGIAMITGLGSLFALLSAYFILTSQPMVLKRLPASGLKAATLIFIFFSSTYGIYFGGTAPGDFWLLLIYFGWLLSCILVFWPFTPQPSQLHWRDLLFLGLVWIPLDCRWLLPLWSWPQGKGSWAYLNSTIVPLSIAVMVGLRGLEGCRLGERIDRKVFGAMVANLNYCTLAIIPLGFAVGFVGLAPLSFEPLTILGSFLGILLMVAIPEELFFRCFLHNLLEKTASSPQVAMLISSLIFGLSHFNNLAYPGGPLPDGRYLFFASVAGYFYARTWRVGGLWAAAIVHAIMDTAWIQLFRVR